MEQEGSVGAAPIQMSSDQMKLAAFRRRTRDLFRYLVTTFQSMLPPEKAEQFGRIALELESSLQEHWDKAPDLAPRPPPVQARDPRRNRFLLRLVIGRVSHLFAGPKPIMPRSLIEGLDRYLKKAFGPIIYEELNAEADQIFIDINADDDRQMWDAIRRTPSMSRFVDTIFIRILFRFENFPSGKKTFITILDATMEEISHFSFGEDQFASVFEALFSELWLQGNNEEQRLRWDFLFGDGTSARLTAILSQGLKRWLKRREGAEILASGRAAAVRRDASAAVEQQAARSSKRPVSP